VYFLLAKMTPLLDFRSAPVPGVYVL